MTTTRLSTTRLGRAFKDLEQGLATRTFTVSDAERVLQLSKRTVSLILKELTDQRTLVRIGRGTYSLSAKPTAVAEPSTLPPASRRLHKTLATEGIQFALSCLDVLGGFTHLALRRYPHFSWVARGSEDWAASTAEAAGFVPIREPTRSQLSMALELAGERDSIIIRKSSIYYGTTNGLATVERALVDLHFEVTRKRYPLDEAELLRVFYYTLTSVSTDFPKMLRYAGLRKLREEIMWILWQFRNRIEIPKTYLDRTTRPTKFIDGFPALDEVISR